jgi:hypothetical protein
MISPIDGFAPKELPRAEGAIHVVHTPAHAARTRRGGRESAEIAAFADHFAKGGPNLPEITSV